MCCDDKNGSPVTTESDMGKKLTSESKNSRDVEGGEREGLGTEDWAV